MYNRKYHNVEQIAGQIQNFATEEELIEWSFALSKTDARTIMNNDCHGVNEDHMFYNWFTNAIFSKIQNAMNDQTLVPTFGMYLNETNPWRIHTDGYHVYGNPNRKSAISFLMPLSVDNDPSLVTESRTIVFDQCRDTNLIEDTESLEDQSNHPNSALHIYKKHLSHNTENNVKKFTVQGQYQWARGSLIWWQGRYFHDSDNFLANGYTSKQALVIHTHYEV